MMAASKNNYVRVMELVDFSPVPNPEPEHETLHWVEVALDFFNDTSDLEGARDVIATAHQFASTECEGPTRVSIYRRAAWMPRSWRYVGIESEEAS